MNNFLIAISCVVINTKLKFVGYLKVKPRIEWRVPFLKYLNLTSSFSMTNIFIVDTYMVYLNYNTVRKANPELFKASKVKMIYSVYNKTRLFTWPHSKILDTMTSLDLAHISSNSPARPGTSIVLPVWHAPLISMTMRVHALLTCHRCQGNKTQWRHDTYFTLPHVTSSFHTVAAHKAMCR